jgi:hypothetical protein
MYRASISDEREKTQFFLLERPHFVNPIERNRVFGIIEPAF